MGEVEVIQGGDGGDDQPSLGCDLIGCDIQVFEFFEFEEELEVVIGNGVVGNGQLAEGGQLADILKCLAGDFVAPDVQALQLFQLG